MYEISHVLPIFQKRQPEDTSEISEHSCMHRFNLQAIIQMQIRTNARVQMDMNSTEYKGIILTEGNFAILLRQIKSQKGTISCGVRSRLG